MSFKINYPSVLLIRFFQRGAPKLGSARSIIVSHQALYMDKASLSYFPGDYSSKPSSENPSIEQLLILFEVFSIADLASQVPLVNASRLFASYTERSNPKLHPSGGCFPDGSHSEHRCMNNALLALRFERTPGPVLNHGQAKSWPYL